MARSTAKPIVLILSEEEDGHIPFVTRHLRRAEPLVIDAQAVAEGAALSYKTRRQGLAITYKGKPLDRVVGVWYRRVRPARYLNLPVDPELREYSGNAIVRHTDALMSCFPDATWVSDPFAIERAEYKPMQLALAARVGLRVPDTLFTSDAEAARAFSIRHKQVVFKAVATRFPDAYKGKPRPGLFTTKIANPKTFNYRGLSLAPSIFQQAIDIAFDLRVTVIGTQLFAAKIVTKGLPTAMHAIRDWRVGNWEGKLLVEPYNLPADIAEKCIELIRRMGLQFGAIDLIADQRGDIWFLENNANGQWAFVEHFTKQPMGKAMAQLLEAGC